MIVTMISMFQYLSFDLFVLNEEISNCYYQKNKVGYVNTGYPYEHSGWIPNGDCFSSFVVDFQSHLALSTNAVTKLMHILTFVYKLAILFNNLIVWS